MGSQEKKFLMFSIWCEQGFFPSNFMVFEIWNFFQKEKEKKVEFIFKKQLFSRVS